MSFRFIRDHAGQWPVQLMCRVGSQLDVSRRRDAEVALYQA